MSSQVQLVDPCAESSAKQKQPTKWSRCVLCQVVTLENLQCPAVCTRSDKDTGYSTLSDNLRRFHEIRHLPLPIDISRLDDECVIEATLQRH